VLALLVAMAGCDLVTPASSDFDVTASRVGSAASRLGIVGWPPLTTPGPGSDGTVAPKLGKGVDKLVEGLVSERALLFSSEGMLGD
jgi:hypothetical protein